MNKTLIYMHQCLAGAGFAVMDIQIAYRLRPDLWSSGQECAMSFRTPMIPEGCQRYIAKLASGRTVNVFARSADALSRRLEWVTGEAVIDLSNAEREQQQPVAVTPPQPTNDKRAKLEALAIQEPPAHDCALRKDILAARRELEALAA